MPELIILLLTAPVLIFYLLLFLNNAIVKPVRLIENLPFVSILISIRNEEGNIEELCNSLDQLDYPKDRFEILIGEDHSSDDSLAVLNNHKPKNTEVFTFDDSVQGKQAVLVELVSKAKGEFLLLTDGDMTFNNKWIQGMIYDSEKSQLRCGVTVVDGGYWFARMQNIDWVLNQLIMEFFCRVGKPLTAWGNNLIIDRRSYDKAGGFAGQEQTIVEDVALFEQVRAIKGKVEVKLDTETLARTKPMKTILDLLHQRKRWMKVLKPIPIWIRIGFGLKLICFHVLIFGCFLNSAFLILLISGGFLFTFSVWKLFHRLELKIRWTDFIAFIGYELVIYFLTFAIYLLPVRTIWKGRYY